MATGKGLARCISVSGRLLCHDLDVLGSQFWDEITHRLT
jgi:hypothetical protein